MELYDSAVEATAPDAAAAAAAAALAGLAAQNALAAAAAGQLHAWMDTLIPLNTVNTHTFRCSCVLRTLPCRCPAGARWCWPTTGLLRLADL